MGCHEDEGGQDQANNDVENHARSRRGVSDEGGGTVKSLSFYSKWVELRGQANPGRGGWSVGAVGGDVR